MSIGYVIIAAPYQRRVRALTSLSARLLVAASRRFIQPRLDPKNTPEAQRRTVELVGKAIPMPRGVTVESIELGGRPTDKLTPPGADPKRAVLHFHGGGFMLGSPRAYRSFAAHLAKAAGCSVYSVQYRLAPEHPFPAALEDAIAAMSDLENLGIEARHIALAGESAGGGLCVSTMLARRAEQQPMPACALLICPFTDLTLSGSSINRNRHVESILRKDWLELCVEYYAAETPREDPALSPIFADLTGLPPMLIQAAGNDMLLDDARRIHAQARDAGVDSKLEVFADLGHVFQIAAGLVPEARRAVAMAGAYIKIRQ